jgi:hypothetical protein
MTISAPELPATVRQILALGLPVRNEQSKE